MRGGNSNVGGGQGIGFPGPRDLSGFVPYNGAVDDLNIGDHDFFLDGNIYLDHTDDRYSGVIYKYNSVSHTYAPFIHDFGTQNLFIGKNAGNFTMTGTYNLVFGSESGTGISTGSENLLFGYSAGGSLTEGTGNLFIGTSAGQAMSTGNYNIMIGNGGSAMVGDENYQILIGDYFGNPVFYADVALGNAAINGYVYGAGGNIALGTGSQAGGYNNTALGYSSFIDDIASNATAIGGGYVSGGTGGLALGVVSQVGSDYGVAFPAAGCFGNYSGAMGRNMVVNGNNSFGISLGDSGGTISTPNTFAIVGGNVIFGNTTPTQGATVEVDGSGTGVAMALTCNGTDYMLLYQDGFGANFYYPTGWLLSNDYSYMMFDSNGISIGANGSIAPPTSRLTLYDGDMDFNTGKAIAMACDNGPTLPTLPSVGQWFLQDTTGRKILFMYNGTVWVPIYSFGALTLYVDTTNGSDISQNQGTGTGASAFKTIQKAIDLIPATNAGSVIINIAAGTYAEALSIGGKGWTGTQTLTLQGALFTTPTLSRTCTSWTQGTAAASGPAPAVLTDTGAFTGLSLQGYFFTKDDVNFFPIIENDNNTITIADVAITSCTTYKVYPPSATILTNSGNNPALTVQASQVNLIINNIKMTNTGSAATLVANDYSSITTNYFWLGGGTGTNGTQWLGTSAVMVRSYVYTTQASSYAMTLSRGSKMVHTNTVVRIGSTVATCMRVNQLSIISGNPCFYISEGAPSGTGYTLLSGSTTLFGQWFKNFNTGVSGDSAASMTYQNPLRATFVSCAAGVSKGYETFNGSIKLSAAPTVVNGSVSGTCTYSQPFIGDYYKKVVAYCNALNGTATYTFPIAFVKTPIIMTTNSLAAAVVTTLNTTTITITGAPSTGFIIIEGY